MKANLPRSWLSLPKKEKDIISNVFQDEINKAVDHEEAELQKVWIQLACVILHNSVGLKKDDLFIFLGNWKRMYHNYGKFKNDTERQKYLKREIDKIFGEGGYPSDWIDSLEAE